MLFQIFLLQDLIILLLKCLQISAGFLLQEAIQDFQFHLPLEGLLILGITGIILHNLHLSEASTEMEGVEDTLEDQGITEEDLITEEAIETSGV